jgi:hypothetical protein
MNVLVNTHIYFLTIWLAGVLFVKINEQSFYKKVLTLV